MVGCDLCRAARITPWHVEDEVCWVADCEICDVPMVVWKAHGPTPPPAAVDHMVAELSKVANARFGPGGWTLDTVMRQIPDHFHAHARDPHWWMRVQGSSTAGQKLVRRMRGRATTSLSSDQLRGLLRDE